MKMPTKLEADVQAITGKTKSYIGTINHEGILLPIQEFALTTRVEIVEEGNGYFLFRYSADGEYAGDSWFSSIDDAKKQAKFEFQIDEDSWKEVSA